MSSFLLSAFADEADPTLAGQIRALARQRLQYLEIRGVEGKNITACSLEQVKAIKRQLDSHHVKISSIGSPLGKTPIGADFAPEIERLRHTLEIAGLLQAPYIRMFSFYIPEGVHPQVFRAEVLDRWRQFLRLAENQGVVLLHENEKGIYGDTPERCLDLLQTLDHPHFKAVFDPANFIQSDVEAYPYAFERLKDHIRYVHVKDALVQGHAVVPAGQGDAHIRAMLQALKRRGYQGFLSVEPHLSDFAGSQALEKSPLQPTSAAAPDALFDVAVNALKAILAQLGETPQFS